MEVHFLVLSSFFFTISIQDFALLKKAISTNLLQQKCISTVKEEVENSIDTAKKKDNILAKVDFTLKDS
tara:strand:+ start:517 stop:723 length:207 start_codon:yes stop_codon:yes gene_type:complete